MRYLRLGSDEEVATNVSDRLRVDRTGMECKNILRNARVIQGKHLDQFENERSDFEDKVANRLPVDLSLDDITVGIESKRLGTA